MARFSKISKPLSKEDNELIAEFCEALSSLQSTEESAKFLTDLLSSTEARMLARRLKIAKLLLDDWKFSEIEDRLKVGVGTIARISEWLKIYGEGYRLIEKRTKKPKPQERGRAGYLWRDLKKRLPLTFWPELLIEDLIRNANKRQKEKIKSILKTMDSKSEVYKRIDRILRTGKEQD